MISKGKVRIICSGYGIKLYWNDAEVTQGVGLNSGINTLGLWTDSSFADWHILQKGSDYFDLKVVFRNLPLSQVWKIKIENEQEIIWQIEMGVEEGIHIDEVRILCLVSTHYKAWINNYKQGDFPRLNSGWYTTPLDNLQSSLVGVRFCEEEIFLPPLALEIQDNKSDNVYPVIENPPLELNAHIIGFKKIDSEEKRDYRPGRYSLFSGKISLFSDEHFLDRKIEELRQGSIQETIQQQVLQEKILLRQACSLQQGYLRLFADSEARRLRLYYKDREIVNLCIFFLLNNTWYDISSCGWQVRKKDVLILNLTWKRPRFSLVWKFSVNDNCLLWQADFQLSHQIDLFKFSLSVIPEYTSFFAAHQQGNFPREFTHWQDIPLEEPRAELIGLRKQAQLPAIVLENSQNLACIIQNSDAQASCRMLQLILPKQALKQKNHLSYSMRVKLLEDETLINEYIKEQKQKRKFLLKQKVEVNRRKAKQKIGVLLVNLPWQKDGKWGVSAGSRWPHIKDRSEGEYLPFPFFLAHATSLLQKHNIEANIIDAIAEQLPEDSFMEKILDMDFDYLVTETSIPSFYDDLRMLERIHRLGISIILCGSNSEIYKPQFLKEHSFIDFVLYGEYEFTLLELIKRLQENGDLSKVKGLIYRKHNEVIKNPKRLPFDINLLPWPCREQLPMNKYWDLPGDIPFPSVQMLASRGCPFGCNFCLWPQVLYQSNVYRTREIKDVVDEMEHLIRKMGFKSVYFDDDTFNIGKERMLRFCQAIKERNLQNIPWAIMARPDLMDEEILTEMKSSGLWAVKYGVESVFEKLLENYQKNMDFQKTDQIIKMTKNLGIKVHLTFTFGISGETKDTIQKTIDYALSSDPNSVQFSILTPFPGTRLFEELDRQGRILSKDWSKYDGHYHCVFQPDNLTPQDLEMAKRQAYRLWGEHFRRRRGFRGDIKRFRDYLKSYGLKCALSKTFDYLGFVWIKRKRYLHGQD